MNPNAIYTKEYHQVQQTQQYAQQSTTVSELKYTVYQDLQNLINLLFSMGEITKQFKNDPNNPMVTISKNKIILQLNLSNTIHRDMEERCPQDVKKQLKETKQKARYIAYESQKLIQPDLQQFITMYTNNSLSDNVKSIEQPLIPTNLQANFNQNVVQQIIQSIQTNDLQYEKVRQSPKSTSPTSKDVIAKAQQYQQMTAQKIAQNFPQARRN